MFLAPSPPRITSRRHIEHWLLLLLRAAALALLVFAFTRPLWRAPITQPNPTNDEELLAILVDTSASMQRAGIWNDLQQQLNARLAKLPPETTVALFQFDRQFVPVISFQDLVSIESSAQRSLVSNALLELKPTWYGTRLGEGLVRTATALQEAQTVRSKPARQRIWLASDLQSGAEIVALQGYEWPADLPVELVQIRPVSTTNAGLQVVERNPESGDDVLRVRVTNSADSAREQFTLAWDVGESPQISVYVPPGQSRILVPPKLPPGIAATSLMLQGDDEPFDNRVYLAESVPETRLVVYCGPETSNDAEGARFYLDRVFAASQRLKIEIQNWTQANTASADAQPALIVMTDPEPDTQVLVRRHLSDGGTVLVVSTTPESLLSSLNLCGRDGITATEASVTKYAMLGDIDFRHPMLAPFAESQFSDFTGIRFWKHRSIVGLNRESSPTDSKDLVLARFDDGDPAIVDLSIQRGHVILFAAGWHPADSQFARSSKFPMLIFRLLEQASGVTPRSGSVSVGNPISWPTTSRLESAATGRVRLPDGTELTDVPLDHPFGQTDRPGLYRLSVPGKKEDIAVNLTPDESRTTPLTPEQLESFGLRLKGRERVGEQQQQRDRERQLQLAELEQSQKLWQLVLLAAMAVLICETFLASRFENSQTARIEVV